MTLSRDTLFKALDGTWAPIAHYRYPIGGWTRHLDPATLEPFRTGYHLARGPAALHDLESALYTAEPCPDHAPVEQGGIVVTCRVRITMIPTWTERVARLLAADCAEAVLLAERACGREPDRRSWVAAETARQHADGLVNARRLTAVEKKAWDAARSASWPADVDGSVSAAAARSAALTCWPVAGPDDSDAWFSVRATIDNAARAAIENATGRTARLGTREIAAILDPDVSQDAWDVLEAVWFAAESAMFDRLALYLNGEPLPPVEPLYGDTMEESRP